VGEKITGEVSEGFFASLSRIQQVWNDGPDEELRHDDAYLQQQVAYSSVAQIDFKRLTIPGAGRNLKDQLACAFDRSATVTVRTEAPPFTGAPAAWAPYETGDTEGHAAAKPRFFGVEYCLHSEPTERPATPFAVSKKILPYVVEQLFDRRSDCHEVVQNRERSLRS
jgi:hypothetical protein